MRITEVVDALSTLSKTKSQHKAIAGFFNPWGVQQRQPRPQPRRPLPELIEELNEKVVDAAKKLQQQLSDSAEQPARDGGDVAVHAALSSASLTGEQLECTWHPLAVTWHPLAAEQNKSTA
jgi:hypothetical protein